MSFKSSITILAGSLQFNRTYQFMVSLENIHNSSLGTIGYLLVRVDEMPRPLIIVA